MMYNVQCTLYIVRGCRLILPNVNIVSPVTPSIMTSPTLSFTEEMITNIPNCTVFKLLSCVSKAIQQVWEFQKIVNAPMPSEILQHNRFVSFGLNFYFNILAKVTAKRKFEAILLKHFLSNAFSLLPSSFRTDPMFKYLQLFIVICYETCVFFQTFFPIQFLYIIDISRLFVTFCIRVVKRIKALVCVVPFQAHIWIHAQPEIQKV